MRTFTKFLFFFGLLIVSFSCNPLPVWDEEESYKDIYFFADYPGKNFYFSRDSEAVSLLIEKIAVAQKSIYMAVYQLNQKEIIEALLLAAERNVQIKIVGDYDERNSDGYKMLQKNNIPIVSGNKSGIQHNKFVIIDNEWLFTGSGNFTENDFKRSTNHFVRIRSKKIVARYLYEFEQMFGGSFGKKKINPATMHNTTDYIQGKKVTVYFFPEQNEQALSAVLSAIAGAKHSIHYMIFAFSQNEIGSALIKASQKIPVEGIHDSTFVKGVSQQAPRLVAAASPDNYLQVFQEGSYYLAAGSKRSGGKMHAKTILIDAGTKDAVVITGSFNWSKNAMTTNDENLIIAHDPDAAQTLLEHYYEQKKAAFVPKLNSQAGSSSAYLESIIISEIGWAGSYAPRHRRTDFFIELYNRSSQEIDLSHWTIEFLRQGEKHGRQYTFRGEENGQKNVIRILPHNYQVFYVHKKGYFRKISQAHYINAGHLSWRDMASLQVKIYDKHMQLNDQAIIANNGYTGYYDWKEKKVASMERIVYPQEHVIDGRLWTSWQSSTKPDPSHSTKMLHSAGLPNSEPQNKPRLALAKKDGIQVFLQNQMESCDLKKITINNISMSDIPTSTNYQINEKGILLLTDLSNLQKNIPHFVHFKDDSCCRESQCLVATTLRFFIYSAQDEEAKMHINEIHYSSNRRKDYIELKVEQAGWSTDLELVSLSSSGFKQIYKFLPHYYDKDEQPIVYLQNNLAKFFLSYDQNNDSNRKLVFNSLHRYLSRQDEVLILRSGKKWIDMVYLSNQDGKMLNALVRNLRKTSKHPLWKFPFLNQEMSKKQIQNFALPTSVLKNKNSYHYTANAEGWKFTLQNKSPSF